MNTTQNKASLWKSCIEQGLFDQVPSGLQPQVQGLFEKTVNQFNNEGLDLGIANQMVLKEFKLQLGKMIGLSLPQKTFEEVAEEYKGQYQAKIPDKIEFSKEMDTPIKDIDLMLKSKAEQRQNEIQEYFKEDPKTRGIVEPPSFNEVPVPVVPKENELHLHRRILESILESQIKIIELLQRK